MIVVKRASFVRLVQPDDTADVSYLEQADFDDRRAAFRRGEFAFVGVRAEVEILIPGHGGDYGIAHHIRSPGLWGIESDAGDDYLGEVFDEECAELEHMLTALGVKVE